MPNEKYLNYSGLQYYHEKLNLDLANMAMTDDNLEVILLDELGIVPPIPETWTESANGTLNLALGNAFSYWPEGTGTKTISITNGTTAGISKFFLKLTDAGNFPMQWENNIQWKNGNEPVWQAFHEDIVMFTSKDGGSTWIGQVVQTTAITPYWKITVQMPAQHYWEDVSISDYHLLIPISPFENNVIIDWGDGVIDSLSTNTIFNPYTEEQSNYGERFANHTYSNDGIYHIKITSNDFENAYMFNAISADYVDVSSYMTTHRMASYLNAVISIDSPLPNLAGSCLDTSSSWHFETNNLSGCFVSYESLLSIPEKIFYNNPQIIDFSYCFNGCSSLASIPSRLFDNNTAVTNFNGCFYGCSSLASIPSRLFDNNTAVTTFDQCFGSCSSLASIPSGLFDNNTAVTTFENCFYKCSSLQSIPSGLFDSNTAVTSFRACFDGCSSLQSIPADLFDNNTQVTHFAECFRGCTSLIAIPSGLFNSNTAVTTFQSCFESCTSLQSIPEGLFANNTAVTVFQACFKKCTTINNFTLNIGSTYVYSSLEFVTKKTGTTRTINVPSGSTTQSAFNSVASSLGLTIVGV